MPEARSAKERRSAGGRFEELDGLRGIAAMWVVIYHLISRPDMYWLENDPALSSQITPLHVNLEGLYAVHLFFLISGFVIFTTIQRCRTVADFAVSRVARLYPAYWVSLILATAIAIGIPVAVQHVTVAQAIANSTMLNLYYRVPDVEPVYWSLAYELAFYFIIAVVFSIGLLPRVELVGLVWVLVAFILLKLFPGIGHLMPWRIQTFLVLPYAHLFFAGILYYKLWSDRFTVGRSLPIAGCYLESIIGAPILVVAIMSGIFILFSLCVAGYARWLACAPLAYLGAISYSLYLTHGTLGYRVQMFSHALGLNPWANFFVAVVITIGVASLVTYVVERPANRAIKRAYKNLSARSAPVSRASEVDGAYPKQNRAATFPAWFRSFRIGFWQGER